MSAIALWRGVLYGCTAAGTYYAVSFIQAYLHRAVAHRAIGGSFHEIHVGSHHTIYAGLNQISDRYSEEERSLTLTFAVPFAALQSIALLALPVACSWSNSSPALSSRSLMPMFTSTAT